MADDDVTEVDREACETLAAAFETIEEFRLQLDPPREPCAPDRELDL